jgi:hypothetical protein
MLFHSQLADCPRSACTVMTPSLDREKAIAIAVNLLKHKSPRLVQALKDLLTFIPNPDYTKDVLEAAVIKLIYTCPEAALWLFQHPELLAPHIQLRKIIAQELTQNLLSWGYTLEDFCFSADHSLKVSENLKSSLIAWQQEAPDKAVLTLIIDLLLL